MGAVQIVLAGAIARKRRRLESYPESKMVHKLADLIGRGRISVTAAAELASAVVP